MIWRWFLFKTVRQATAMRKHVWRLLMAQRDLLAPQAIEALTAALGEMGRALAAKADKTALQKQMENLEKAANKWLKPYPYAAWRENVEVLLVALAVAMGIRTFFLQPFKIPTGSMQPTLYGSPPRTRSNARISRYPAAWPVCGSGFREIRMSM
jgi:signal peptidase I